MAWKFLQLESFGRTRSSRIFPTGSGSARLRANLCHRENSLSSSWSRSSMADDKPNFAPAFMSSALACLIEPEFFSSASAIASRQSFFSRVESFASWRDAALACLASCVICSVKFMAANPAAKLNELRRLSKCHRIRAWSSFARGALAGWHRRVVEASIVAVNWRKIFPAGRADGSQLCDMMLSPSRMIIRSRRGGGGEVFVSGRAKSHRFVSAPR